MQKPHSGDALTLTLSPRRGNSAFYLSLSLAWRFLGIRSVARFLSRLREGLGTGTSDMTRSVGRHSNEF